MIQSRRRQGTIEQLRRMGTSEVARLVRRRTWSSKIALGLRADLEALPGPRPAGITVVMQPTDATAFDGFAVELGNVAGREALELTERELFCRAGLTTLFVAADDAGAPIYAQWLIRTRGEQDRLERATKGLYRHLDEGEALVEGAYTFVDYRGLGAMADGMYQLLLRAREAGDRSALTYVDADNVPSLRGCARAGFALDHVRDNRWRFGRRVVRWTPLDKSAEAAWEAATR
jgi:hypothetical protein